MAWALGVDDLEELNHNLAKTIDLKLPQGMKAALNRGRDLFGVLKSIGLGPKIVSHAPVQEVVLTGDQIALSKLPILKCWPQDGGKYITLMQVITRDPVTNIRNVGMYRLQMKDDRTLMMHWQRHKGGAEHERVAQEEKKPLIPCAIVLGGDPAAMWCASAPLPPNIDEFLLAGYLRGKPVEFVKCVTQPIEAPANAEIVIEGYVDPNEHDVEGPFGDHTGFYTPADRFPVFHVTAITHRQDRDLSDDGRGQAADGRLLDGQGDRAVVLAAACNSFSAKWSITTCPPKACFTTSSSFRSRSVFPAIRKRRCSASGGWV